MVPMQWNNRKLIDHIFKLFDDIDKKGFEITSVNLPFILFLFR